MNRNQPTSMSNSFHAHGLAGIDLHHTASRREAQRVADSNAQAVGRSTTSLFRQRLGSMMIALGEHLAGHKPVQPRTARFV